MEVPDCPAVRYEMPFESPLSAEFSHQVAAGAAGLVIGAVVCAHNGFDICFLHESPKCRKIRLFQILRRSDGVEAVAESLRPAVHGEMLGTGGSFQCITAALQPAYKSFSKAGGQIWVFTVGLVPASPPGIAENIDVRRPHCQAVIYVPVSFCQEGIIFCPRFCGNGVCNLLQKFIVKHGGHPNGLRKACRSSAASKPVQRFIPPVVFRDAQPFDGRRVKPQLASLFLDGHFRDKLFRLFSGFFSSHLFSPSL